MSISFRRLAGTVRYVMALAPALAVVSTARAQWVVTNLHPAGATESAALGVGQGQQVGYARVGPTVGDTRASLWTGSAASWVNLQPTGAGITYSTVYAVDAGVQVGEVFVNGGATSHAARWTGSAASFIDLHPADAFQSTLRGVSAGRQVGTSTIFWAHAGLWTGPAPSWIDLSPPAPGGETYTAEAYGVSGVQQVGFAEVNSVISASLWSGSAASRVDLHPAGQISSWAYGVDGAQQVGIVRVADSSSHAALWRGSPGSWVDLHPPGALNSRALDVFAGTQVGVTTAGGLTRATLWRGTAASRVDLHSFLPASFVSSEATAIWGDAFSTVIVGWGYNSATTRAEALMWSGPALCLGDFNTDGVANSADFFDFLVAFFAASPSADFNRDGTVNSQDLFDFLAAFFVGC
ncbi:MAG: GC-type dockerin domain-anchored protein [Phycisphaerales bacterium]